MAHEIYESDNMFSVGRTPWHGLGTILDHPPSIEEGLIASNLNWQVRLLPLYCQVPELADSHQTIGEYREVDVRAVLREDTNEILGTVGMNYTPLQNIEAFKVFEPLVDSKELLLETAGSLKNGRRVWVLGRINTDGADIGKNDQVNPYVLLSNSHDGTMAVRFGFTPIRVVCHNTLSAAEGGDVSKLIRLIHTSGIHENLDALRNMLNLAKNSFKASIEQYRWLASKDINSADLDRYVKIVFTPEFEKVINDSMDNAEGIDITMKPSEKKVIQLFENGLGSGMPKAKTWWGAYNAFNEFLMHHRGKNVDTRINSIWFDHGRRWDKSALETAIRLAA